MKKNNYFAQTSYFKQVVIAYLILLSFQVITVVVFNVTLHTTIEKTNQNIYDQYINQFFNIMENRFLEFSNIQSTMLNDLYTEQYLYNALKSSNGVPYDVIPLQKSIQNSVFLNFDSNYTIFDAFIYFEDNDRIVSGFNTSLLADEYFKLNYDETNFEDLSDFFSDEYEQSVIVFEDRNKQYLAVSLPNIVTTSGFKSNFHAVIVLSDDFMPKLLDFINLYDEAEILIFDTESNLLISSNENSSITLKDNYEDSYTDSFNDKEYTILTYRSGIIDVIYAVAVPTDIYGNDNHQLMLISLLGLGTFILLSIILISRLSLFTYKPMKNIVTQIETITKDSSSIKVNEMAYIYGAFEDISSQRDLLMKKMGDTDKKVKYAFLSKLLGGINSANDGCFSDYDLNTVSDMYCVLIFRLDDYSKDVFKSMDNELLFSDFSFLYENVLSELSQEYGRGFLFPQSYNKFVLILNLNPDSLDYLEYVKKLTEDFCKVMQRYFKIKNTVIIGSCENGLSGISTSYTNALYAMNFRFVYKKHSIICFDEIVITDKVDLFDNDHFSNMIISYVQGFSNESAISISKSIVSEMQASKGVSFIKIENFKFTVIHALEDVISNIDELYTKNFYASIRILIHAESLEEFEDVIISLLEELRFYHQNNEISIEKKIAEYIENNYWDINLSNILIADYFNVSQSHLFRIFKSSYNKTPLEYITETRIKHVKNLLEETNLTVGEIAERTGFLSANTLIRSFKKAEGITPRVYAELKKDTGI